MPTPVPWLLILAASLPLAAEEVPTQFVSRRTNVLGLSQVADPASVASAALFSTSDGGQSWQLVEEVAAPADGRSFPKFTFTAPADGTYGLYSRTIFRSGHREADPRPGTGPLYVLVVDSTPPVFTTAEVRLLGHAAGVARFHATWALVEAHPDDPAVTIEVLAGDGHFLTVGSGSAKGSLELSAPVPEHASSLAVRFSATDRAGNATRTPPALLSLTPPRLSGTARAELAQAVREMPSLSELGIGRSAPPAAEVAIAVPRPPLPRRPVPRTPAAMATAPATPPAPPAMPSEPPPPAVPDPTTPVPPAIPASPAIPDAATLPPTIPASADLPPAIPAAPVVVDGQRRPPPTLAYLSGSQADDALRDARVAVRFERMEEALDFYDRVLSSSRLEDGIHDLVHLLTRLSRPKDLCTVVESLAPEYHDDQVRLEHGRALTTLKRWGQAEAVLSGIGSRCLEAREARYLIALCWRATGREADAATVLANLAKGEDDVAGLARAALAGR